MGKQKPRLHPFYPRLQAEKAKVSVQYHGRIGMPMIHFSQPVTRPTMKGARPYVMVRKEGGGTERLYLGNKKSAEIEGITKLRQEAIRIKKRQMRILRKK